MEAILALFQLATTALQILVTGIVSVGAVYLTNQMKKIETSRQQHFDRLIAEMERKDRFRLAAIDKRLEAHQKAYALFDEMVCAVGELENIRSEINGRVHHFWCEYSLYLSDTVRTEFKFAWGFFNMTTMYQTHLKSLPDAKEYEAERASHMQRWDRFMALPRVIEKSLNLESFGNEPAFDDAREKFTSRLDA